MDNLAVLTDSLLSVTDEPVVCPRCGTAARIARGNCVSCLLAEGVAHAGEGSVDTFASILDQAHVPDQNWRLGNYEILGEIGRGGMGIIYRARQHHSQRIVAIKRILSFHANSSERMERFRREAEAAASLDHPNILPIYEVSESAKGTPFFSMKWATGGSLRDVGPALRARPRECVRLMAKVARAIEFAHARGILHRDLQPGNILLDGHGEPLVTDFGLVKWLGDESDLTLTQSMVGTPGFIAPEQAEGSAADLTAAADIYGLGAVLFSLLAGRPPFLGTNTLAVLRKAAETDAPKLRTLAPTSDRDLETVVSRCLERDPKARYRSAGDLAEDLERWLDGRSIRARPVLFPAQLWRWSRRNPSLAVAAAICLALGAAVVGLLRSSPPPVGEGPAPDKSIAVLPFENLNQDPENAFFTTGMQEDILANLAKVADLKVISRSSVREYRPERTRDLRAIARDLGVRHLLEGSVRRADGRVRITAHLTDTTNGTQIWAEQYDRELPHVFAIQSEIANRIADQLQAYLSPKEQATIQARPTRDLVAYELYLKAKEISQRPGLTTAERISSRTRLLEEAVAHDPTFVSAFCRLARVHVEAYWTNHDHTPARLEAAVAALEAAARLQPDSGEVHQTRGIIRYWGYRDYIPALAELEKAAVALPNEAEVPYFIALITRREGDWERSTRTLEEARTMDPRNEIILFDLARTNYFAQKRYGDAAAIAESVLAWKPGSFDFHLTRAKVDVASRADLRRWREVVWGEPAKTAEANLLASERLELALAERDYPAAEAALRESKLPEFNWAGYITPQQWYQGLIAKGLGDKERAQGCFAAARDAVATIVAQRPDDAKAQIILAEIEAQLGRKSEAVAAGERALALRPVARDAVDGPNIMGRLAGVYAQLGEIHQALDLLEVAARLPVATNYGALKIEGTWDPLRGHPRFEAIVAALAPKDAAR